MFPLHKRNNDEEDDEEDDEDEDECDDGKKEVNFGIHSTPSPNPSHNLSFSPHAQDSPAGKKVGQSAVDSPGIKNDKKKKKKKSSSAKFSDQTWLNRMLQVDTVLAQY